MSIYDGIDVLRKSLCGVEDTVEETTVHDVNPHVHMQATVT